MLFHNGVPVPLIMMTARPTEHGDTEIVVSFTHSAVPVGSGEFVRVLERTVSGTPDPLDLAAFMYSLASVVNARYAHHGAENDCRFLRREVPEGAEPLDIAIAVRQDPDDGSAGASLIIDIGDREPFNWAFSDHRLATTAAEFLIALLERLAVEYTRSENRDAMNSPFPSARFLRIAAPLKGVGAVVI